MFPDTPPNPSHFSQDSQKDFEGSACLSKLISYHSPPCWPISSHSNLLYFSSLPRWTLSSPSGWNAHFHSCAWLALLAPLGLTTNASFQRGLSCYYNLNGVPQLFINSAARLFPINVYYSGEKSPIHVLCTSSFSVSSIILYISWGQWPYILSLSLHLAQCLSHNIYSLFIWWMNEWIKLIKWMSKWTNLNSNYSKHHNIEKRTGYYKPNLQSDFSLSLAFIRNDQMTHHLHNYIVLCVPWTLLTKLNYIWSASYAHTSSTLFFFELLLIKTSMISFGHWFSPSSSHGEPKFHYSPNEGKMISLHSTNGQRLS